MNYVDLDVFSDIILVEGITMSTKVGKEDLL